jgi:hypothetical protein
MPDDLFPDLQPNKNPVQGIWDARATDRPPEPPTFTSTTRGYADPRPLNKRHEKYLKFKAENPDVMAIIRRICVGLIKRGRHFSLRGVIYVVRFEEYFKGYRDEPYRICDHHSPYIARELVEEFPECEKLITMCRVEGEAEAQEEMEQGEEF